MQGRAALRGEPDVWADVTVLGLLEVVGIDPTSGVLDARVEILVVDTRQVSVQGLAPPAERLVNARHPEIEIEKPEARTPIVPHR
jgi:hypothetical protein